MKKLILICTVAFFASCTATKLGGVEITKFEKTDSVISVGVHVFGKGQLSSNAIEVKYLDIAHTDSTFDGNVLLNIRTK